MVGRGHGGAGWRPAVWLAAPLLTAAQALAATPPPLFVEALVEPASVYEGQQARVVVRLYRQRDAPAGQLEELRLGERAEVSRLGQIRVFETDHEGHRYRVLERRYAVRPLASGPLTLPALRFQARVADAQQFAAPTAAEADGARAAAPVSGPALTLEVRARPDGAANPWLPALDISATERWSADPALLEVGDAVTRTITLRASGVTGSGLPAVAMDAAASLDLHHDRPATRTHFHADGVRGQREQRIVVIATRPGTVQMPAWQLRWWDVTADAERTITLPARTIRVVATAPVDTARAGSPGRPDRRPPWLAALAAALGTAAVVWALRRRGRALRTVRRRLRRACRAGDALEARMALMDWATLTGPQPARDLHTVAARFHSAAARAAVADLTAALYGRGGVLAGLRSPPDRDPEAVPAPVTGPAQAWSGDALWSACRDQLGSARTDRRGSATAGEPLPGLYPLAASSAPD